MLKPVNAAAMGIVDSFQCNADRETLLSYPTLAAVVPFEFTENVLAVLSLCSATTLPFPFPFPFPILVRFFPCSVEFSVPVPFSCSLLHMIASLRALPSETAIERCVVRIGHASHLSKSRSLCRQSKVNRRPFIAKEINISAKAFAVQNFLRPALMVQRCFLLQDQWRSPPVLTSCCFEGAAILVGSNQLRASPFQHPVVL